MDPRKLDVRTVHRHIQQGVVERSTYEKALGDLPDLEGEAEFVDYEGEFSREAEPAKSEPTPVFVNEPGPDTPPNYGFGPPPGSIPPGTDGAGGSTI